MRDHSAALRQGVCETLVILAVRGNNLFHERLGIDVRERVSLLISRLLSPLTHNRLLSHNNDLPRYAEAAPDAFLKCIENDLRQAAPVVLGLLKPAEAGAFGGYPRTGLLWALECLAWKPPNLPRVVTALAQLSRTTIEDNWVNKPIASLSAIFRSWMPQTAASLEVRKKALEMLVRDFPDTGWQICIAQFEPGPQIGAYSYRPRWRSDALGAGQPVSRKETYEFSRKALDLALAWSKHDENTLGDLAERLQGMPEEDQAAVWDKIEAWAGAETDDRAKAALRERIRRATFTRRARHRGMKEVPRDRARKAYEKRQPCDVVIRHEWLFANQWVEESAEELEDDDYDISKREQRVSKLRTAAVKEMWAQRGFDGIAALLATSGAPHTVGQCLASCLNGTKPSVEFLRNCLALDGDLTRKADGCIRGFLWALDAKGRAAILPAVAANEDQSGKVTFSPKFGPAGG